MHPGQNPYLNSRSILDGHQHEPLRWCQPNLREVLGCQPFEPAVQC